MPLDQDQQPRIASLLAAVLVFGFIAGVEVFGVFPEPSIGGLPNPIVYVSALIVILFTSAVFSRSPDDLEQEDHLLHGWAVVLVLVAIAVFSITVGIGDHAGTARQVKAFLFDAALTGTVLGWGFHNFQDQFL